MRRGIATFGTLLVLSGFLLAVVLGLLGGFGAGATDFAVALVLGR